MSKEKIKIFTGRSNPQLGVKIATALDVPLGKLSIKDFADGEIWIKFEENIRSKDVFIIQSTNGPAENILELVLILDAAVRASAKSVTAVIPYFGYARQDRKDTPRVPISARVMVDMFTAAGAKRIVTMDLHSTQIQGFANIPFDHLYSRIVLLDEIKALGLDPKNSAVLSPDVGSARMSQAYAKSLGMHFALIDKRRYAPNKAETMHLIGELDGKNVLIIDDMIDTAGTLCNAAETSVKEGAKSVTAIATHPVLSGEAISRLKETPISKVIVCDTIKLDKEKRFDKLEIVSVADVFGESMKRIVEGTSLSSLFRGF